MQLVIDIQDASIEDYRDLYHKIYGMAASEGLFDDRVKSQRALALKVVLNVLEGVVKGTPLPKGHRFIDADEILDHAFIRDDEEGDIFVQKYYCIKKEIVDNALVLFDTLEEGKEQ